MALPPITISELLAPGFLEEVSRLSLLVRRVARFGNPAEQRSAHMGAGMEFRDFRPYTPGDDFRAIDWNIYRRLGRVVLRLFEDLEDLPVYVAIDNSLSMFHGDNPRCRAGQVAGFALASVALAQHDRVGVFPFADDLNCAMRPSSGKGRQLRAAEVIAGIKPAGSTNFVQAMRRLNGLGLRRGLLVVISDFFDPSGMEAVAAALGSVRHRLILIQLVRKDDADPTHRGDLRMVDCESGIAHDVSATKEVLSAYKLAHKKFEQSLAKITRSRKAGLLRLDVDEPVVEQLAKLFATGEYVA